MHLLRCIIIVAGPVSWCMAKSIPTYAICLIIWVDSCWQSEFNNNQRRASAYETENYSASYVTVAVDFLTLEVLTLPYSVVVVVVVVDTWTNCWCRPALTAPSFVAAASAWPGICVSSAPCASLFQAGDEFYSIPVTIQLSNVPKLARIIETTQN